VAALSVLLPLWQLVSSPRTWTELAGAIAASKAATLNSLMFAGGSALLVLAFALLLQHRNFPLTLWAFFLVPGVLLGIGMIWLFNRPVFNFFYGSAAIVLLAYLLRFAAFGWAGLRVAAMSFDQAPIQVVRAFGGSPWQQFRLAVWPQSRNLVVGTFLLVYLLCLWEVETLILIVPPGRDTLALRIFNMLHYGHAGQVNALCVWLLVLALAPLLLVWLVMKFRSAAFLLAFFACFAGLGCGPEGSGAKLESSLFSTVQVIGTRGTGAGQFNKPRSVALDRDDNLYVVDLTGRVQKFSPDGQFLLLWQMPQTDKGKPKGMVQDAGGNIIVIEPHYSRVNHFDPRGQLVTQWGESGASPGQLTFPRSAALNSSGEIFLSEYGQVERVLRFAPGGHPLLSIIGSAGTGIGEFNRPEGIGTAPDDRLFVADSCNHRVQVFDRAGRFLSAFGAAGSDAGQMSYPYDVRIDALGTIFVCEFGNSRVQVFDRKLKPVETIGGSGGEPGHMHNPWAIALDSRGNLYVADSGNHRVQKFIRRDPLASPAVAASAGGPPP
jgi:DNA-binding beta-propeller fold protein YncE/ABC-type spermidine/putrescine transport system permease subunit II